MKIKGTNITKYTELKPNESALNKINFPKFPYHLGSATSLLNMFKAQLQNVTFQLCI